MKENMLYRTGNQHAIAPPPETVRQETPNGKRTPSRNTLQNPHNQRTPTHTNALLVNYRVYAPVRTHARARTHANITSVQWQPTRECALVIQINTPVSKPRTDPRPAAIIPLAAPVCDRL
jgi:hypothetical protein